MNHSWLASKTNKLVCIHCNRDYISHMDIVACDACGLPRRCDLFGDILNPKTMLLCIDCTNKEIKANDEVIERTKIWQDAAKIDDSITYNGDFFNAKTVAIIELKRSIDEDASIEPDKKKFKFMELLAARYAKFSKVAFLLEKKTDEIKLEKLAIAKSLRSFGDSLRKDIREQIAIADSNYAPPIVKKPVRAVVKPLEKKSAIDMLIDKMMLMDSGIKTREEALEQIRTFKKD